MPRIRYLKPEFFTDEDLAELPPITRLTFAGLWCHSDRSGRLEDRPKFLKAMIWPYENVDIEKQLTALGNPKHNGKPFIQRYSVDGSSYIQIVNWDRHQKPHHTETPSKIPDPPPLTIPLREDKGNGEVYSVEQASAPTSNRLETVKERLYNLGQFNNVKLSEVEYQKLNEKFGEDDAKSRIEVLSEYLASKGKKYNSHYATILAWARKDGWKDGDKGNGGEHDNLFLRTIREENERAARGRMGGRTKPVSGHGYSEGGSQGNGGVSTDADPSGCNPKDGDKPEC